MLLLLPGEIDAGWLATFGVTVVDLVGRLRSTGGDKVATHSASKCLRTHRHTVQVGEQLCDDDDDDDNKQKPIPDGLATNARRWK